MQISNHLYSLAPSDLAVEQIFIEYFRQLNGYNVIRCTTSWLIRIATVGMLLTGILLLVFNFIKHDIVTEDRAEAARRLFESRF
jgi:hypothetical protein